MTNRIRGPVVHIDQTAHRKFFYKSDALGDEVQESPLPDALDFPGTHGRVDLEAKLKARYPDVVVGVVERRFDYVAEIGSAETGISRDQFVDVWQKQFEIAEFEGFDEFKDPFRRFVHVELSGKDRVRRWSGWFHYPLLIADSRRQMEESAARLVKLFESKGPLERDVIEEAYYEQVMRERLAIFERRRESWRVIRWGGDDCVGHGPGGLVSDADRGEAGRRVIVATPRIGVPVVRERKRPDCDWD